MAIHDRLKGTDKVIIIDEAQNLRFDALEELRSLSDPDDLTGESGTGICLIGNSEVYSRMLGKQEAQFAQQFSRVRFRRRYSTADVKLADVEKLFPTLADGSHGKELRNMDMKEKLLAEMEQSDFAKNNGKIMRTLNVLAPSYHNLSSIQRILKDDGIGEGQYAACLDFLALEGYILLRTVKDHVRCEDLADHNWTELEAKLSGKGMRVLEKDVKDAMIEV